MLCYFYNLSLEIFCLSPLSYFLLWQDDFFFPKAVSFVGMTSLSHNFIHFRNFPATVGVKSSISTVSWFLETRIMVLITSISRAELVNVLGKPIIYLHSDNFISKCFKHVNRGFQVIKKKLPGQGSHPKAIAPDFRTQ